MYPSPIDDNHVVGLDSVEELQTYMCSHSSNSTLSSDNNDSFRQIGSLRLRIMDIKKGKGGAKGGMLTFKFFSHLNHFSTPFAFSSGSSISTSLSLPATSLASWKSFCLTWKTIALRTFSTRSHVKGYRCGRCAAEYFDDGEGFFIISEDDERSAKVLGVFEDCANTSERNPTYLLSSGSVPTTGAVVTLRIFHRDPLVQIALTSMVCSVDHVAMEIIESDNKIDIKSGMRNRVVAKVRPDYAAKKRLKSKKKRANLPSRMPSTRASRTPAKYTEVDEDEDEEEVEEVLEESCESEEEEEEKLHTKIEDEEEEKKSHPTMTMSFSSASCTSSSALIQPPHPINPLTLPLAHSLSQRRNSLQLPQRGSAGESPFELEDFDSDSSSTTSSSSNSTPRAVSALSDGNLMSSSMCAASSSSTSSASSSAFSSLHPSSSQLPALHVTPSLRPTHSSFSSFSGPSTSSYFGGSSYSNVASSPNLTCQPFTSLPNADNEFTFALNSESLFNCPSLDRVNSIQADDMTVQQSLSVSAKPGLKRGHSEGNQGTGIAASVGASTSSSVSMLPASTSIAPASISSILSKNSLAVTDLTEALARQEGLEIPKRRRLFSNSISNLTVPLEKQSSLLASSPLNDDISRFMKFERAESGSLSTLAFPYSMPALSPNSAPAIATNNQHAQNLQQFWNTQFPTHTVSGTYGPQGGNSSASAMSHGGHSYSLSYSTSMAINNYNANSLCPPPLGRNSSIDNVPSLNITMTAAFP